jgi:hypothetical protein
LESKNFVVQNLRHRSQICQESKTQLLAIEMSSRGKRKQPDVSGDEQTVTKVSKSVKAEKEDDDYDSAEATSSASSSSTSSTPDEASALLKAESNASLAESAPSLKNSIASSQASKIEDLLNGNSSFCQIIISQFSSEVVSTCLHFSFIIRRT